ncbi:MAG: hypothetical protein ACLGJB_06290 [Blastocatellia bacterium]
MLSDEVIDRLNDGDARMAVRYFVDAIQHQETSAISKFFRYCCP